MISFCLISNMNQSNSIEAIEKTKLTEQRKFQLDEMSKLENYFQAIQKFWRHINVKVDLSNYATKM